MEKALQLLKKHRFDIIVACSVLAFLADVYFNKHTFSIMVIAFYILGYRERNETNIAERKRLLLARGITPEDLKNIAFVKDWDETRKKGMVKFSLVYGGVFFGFVLCGLINIITLMIKKDMLNYISADPLNMISFIGYTYMAGMIGGTIFYRLIWIYKEQKFIRLTDPLH
jgi:hypothetical protein